MFTVLHAFIHLYANSMLIVNVVVQCNGTPLPLIKVSLVKCSHWHLTVEVDLLIDQQI